MGQGVEIRLILDGTNDGAVRAVKQVTADIAALNAAAVGGGQAAATATAAATREAVRTGDALRRADAAGNFGKTRQGLESISTQLAGMRDAVSRLTIGAGAFGATAGLFAGLVRAADEMKGVEARVKLASASLIEFKVNMAAIRAVAAASGTEVASVAALFNRIALPIRDMGGSATEARQAVALVGQALRVSGATAAESSAAMLQFAQAMGSGALRGEELNSILENAPRLAQAIAAGLGVTVGELKKLGEQGALTSQQVLRAIQSQSGALAEEAARLPLTVGMAWTNLGEGVKHYVSEVDKSSGATAAMAKGINAVAAGIPAIASGFANVALILAGIFAVRGLTALTARVTAWKLEVAAAREAAAANLVAAESTIAVSLARQRLASANIAAVQSELFFAAGANAAALASQKAAASAALLAANQGAVSAQAALAAAQTANAAASVGLLGRAMGAVGTLGRGLFALVGGWPGLIITAIGAAILWWDKFRGKTQAAADQTRVSLAEMTQRFAEFAGKSGPGEAAADLEKLRDAARLARIELNKALFAADYKQSPAIAGMTADLKAAETAIDAADKRMGEFVRNRTKERGLLGLDKLAFDFGGLIGTDTAAKLNAFDTLYASFVAKATGENNRLIASALEVREALSAMLSAARTPADFAGVIRRIETAIAATSDKGGKSALRSTLENALEGRAQAEKRDLDAFVSGLEARAARTRALFDKSAGIALAQFTQAAALARVAAELKNDVAIGSKIDAAGGGAEVAVARESAAMQVRSLESVAERRRSLVQENAAAIQAQARDEVESANFVRDQKIRAIEQEYADGKITAGKLADERNRLNTEHLEKTRVAIAARGGAEADAARQIRAIDAQTARERADIAEGLYKAIAAKANEALAAYKGYAQQVLALDKAIATNRLDTASSVNALKRQDMTPQDQAKSLADEMASIQRATGAAQKAGSLDNALELLNRQKSVAQEIARIQGEGIDPKKQREAAISELERIGSESETILTAQRDAAQQAAATQLQQYQAMTQAMNELAGQIAKLNEQAAIKLKPEIDAGALSAAVEAVKSAFAGLTVPIQVAPMGLPNGAGAVTPQVPALAGGGPLRGPGHDTSDNLLAWLSPGEWVIRARAVRHYGSGMIDAINRMALPKFAGGGMVSRLAIPELSPVASGGGTNNVTFNFPEFGSFTMQAGDDMVQKIKSAFARESLKRGRR